MKNSLQLLMAIVMVSFLSCSEDEAKKEPVIAIENEPSAKAADDTKASGVYKGTFVGSSGSFKLIVEAGQVVGYLVVDGQEFILTSDDVTPESLNGAITNALFTDAGGKVELYFSVEADGENPTATLTIDGHEDVKVVVYKETSNTLLKIFEGFEYKTYPELGVQVKGHFNIILGQDSLARVAYKSIEEKSLNNGNSGSNGNQSWASEAIYHVLSFYPGDKITIYRYYPDPENPLGPQKVENVLYGDNLNYTDTKISATRHWTEGEFSYADSIRLLRKL